jgi:hypothetical protein
MDDSGVPEKDCGQHDQEAGGGYCAAGCLHEVLRSLQIENMKNKLVFFNFLPFYIYFLYYQPVSRPLAVYRLNFL